MKAALSLAAALANLLATLLAAPLACAADKPGIDAFFDAMAIRVAPGQQKRFVVGDNVAGYFEGYTQGYARGEGYVRKDGVQFRTYASYSGGALNDRANSLEDVLPYGHRVRHANGATEEMALLAKRHALAFSVAAPSNALLALKPHLKAAGAVRREGDALVVAPADGTGQYLAMAANVPFTHDAALVLRTRDPVRSFTVVAAFGASAGETAARAVALAAGDPIGDERSLHYEALTRSYLSTSDTHYNKALNWAKAASRLFVVEEFGTGIWAGLPWFRDNWGRDTFIALPGTLLVSGQFADARAVLENFARYQNLREPRDREYGRVPNRVAAGERVAGEAIIYNTVDGTPWMLREALEYIRYTGDQAFARQAYKLALPYFEGAAANYVDADGLLAHDAADTWMDARIENRQPWSARGARAVEIQALWYTALQTGAYLAAQAGDEAKAWEWGAMAAKAQRSFLRLYWDGRTMADRLREDASRDTSLRPNQLMLVSIPFDDFVPPAVQARVTKNTVSGLLYPYGIASLGQDERYFHPRHENPAYHQKDAAYHQGTIWGWNAGFTVTALNKFGYQDLAYRLSKNLGGQILGLGTLGNMSELLDALPHEGGALKPSGTYAQSWSVAEYARNGYQDYVGFRPNLLENTLAFAPAIPSAWTSFDARLPFGSGEALEVEYLREGAAQRWTFRLAGGTARRIGMDFLNADKSRSRAGFELAPGETRTLVLKAGKATLDGSALAVVRSQVSFAASIGELGFVVPKRYRPQDFPMLRGKDVLKGIVERNEYR